MTALHRLPILFAILAVLAVPAAVRAETVYVSDELVITLRAGQGGEFKIMDYLETGTPLKVLRKDTNYIKVRTPEGKEGWVLKRYVKSEMPKAVVIENLTKEIESMKATMGDAEKVLSERDRLLDENVRLRAEKEDLELELRQLERKELFYWFLAGAGVLFLGWLIGKASRQKRYY